MLVLPQVHRSGPARNARRAVAALFAFASLMPAAENYTATRTTVDGVEVVHLTDAAHRAEASIIPSLGNIAYELKIAGVNAFYWPYRSLAEFKAKPGLAGNPFLA